MSTCPVQPSRWTCRRDTCPRAMERGGVFATSGGAALGGAALGGAALGGGGTAAGGAMCACEEEGAPVMSWVGGRRGDYVKDSGG